MRRRTLLASAGAGALLTTSGLPAAPAQAAPAQAVSGAALRSFAVQGTDISVALLPGAAATVLLYAARRFHYEIDALHPGTWSRTPRGSCWTSGRGGIRPGRGATSCRTS